MLNLLLEGGEQATEQGSSPAMIIILCVLGVLIIGMFIWSTISGKKKQKEAQALVDGIKIGDKVKTIGGICGYVVEIDNDENTIVLETGLDTNKSFVKFDKGAIYQTAPANSSVETATKPAEEPVAEVKDEQQEAKPTKKSNKKSKKNADKKVEEVKDEKVEEPVVEPVEEVKEETTEEVKEDKE